MFQSLEERMVFKKVVPMTSKQRKLNPEETRQIKQSVIADMSCVLARAAGADIPQKQALTAARNICEILFAHPDQPRPEIPKLFWDTPLGRAVGACCANDIDLTNDGERRVRTTLELPTSLTERLRLEADALNKPLDDLVTEKLKRG